MADTKSPISTAVIASLAVVVFVMTIFLSIGGSYLIGVTNANTIKSNDQAFEQSQKALRTREEESAVRTSIPTCKALIGLDNAKNGASNASKDPHSYGHNLARAITKVVDDTGCRRLIAEVNSGTPLLKIAQQEAKAADGGA